MWYYYCIVSKRLTRALWARGDCAWREDVNQQSNRLTGDCCSCRWVTNSYRTEHRCSPQMTCLTRAHRTSNHDCSATGTLYSYERVMSGNGARYHCLIVDTAATANNSPSPTLPRGRRWCFYFISLTRRHWWYQTRHTRKQSNKRDWKVPITINSQIHVDWELTATPKKQTPADLAHGS